MYTVYLNVRDGVEFVPLNSGSKAKGLCRQTCPKARQKRKKRKKERKEEPFSPSDDRPKMHQQCGISLKLSKPLAVLNNFTSQRREFNPLRAQNILRT